MAYHKRQDIVVWFCLDGEESVEKVMLAWCWSNSGLFLNISPLYFSGAEGVNDFEETIDLNKAFETSMGVDVGHHPFANMEENPDNKKTKVLQGIPAAEYRKAEARRRLVLSYNALK